MLSRTRTSADPFEALGFSIEAGNWEELRKEITEEATRPPGPFRSDD